MITRIEPDFGRGLLGYTQAMAGERRRRRSWDKRVVGEWLIPSMEGRSYAMAGKPKAVERELTAAKAYLLGLAEALKGER